MSTLVVSFAAIRIAAGLVSWLAPAFAARVAGLEPTLQPFVARLVGARDVALGVALLTSDAALSRRALQIGVAVDAADVAAAVVGVGDDSLTPRSAMIGGGAAAAFAVLGLVALHYDEVD